MSSIRSFSETKKPKNDATMSRGTQSVIKPKKHLFLKPLDMNAIKWELDNAEALTQELLAEFADLKTICDNKKVTLETVKEANDEANDSFEMDFSHLPATPVRNPSAACVFIKPNESCAILRSRCREKENEQTCAIFKEPHCRTLVINKNVYVVLNLIGKGGSSEVYAGFCTKFKRHVAIKCINLNKNPPSSTGYVEEVELLKKLQNCDKVIKMYDYEIKTTKKLFIILEKGCEDLKTVVKNLPPRMPNYLLVFYWMEMLHAVKQIHAHNVIHSDLKPANFLCTSNGLKLIDFGISSCVEHDTTSILKLNPEGSCNYVSPEAINPEVDENGGKYKLHFKSDVWSLGCILYQLVYRKTPFHDVKRLSDKLICITNPNYRIEYPNIDFVPAKIVNTIKKCLRYDVRSRPSIDELISEYDDF